MGYVMEPGITVVIPTIPPRTDLLARARISARTSGVAAALAHDMRFDLVTAFDGARLGAAETRHRGLMEVHTEWVAFLDDDDEMLPAHLSALYCAALEYDADFVWSRFQISLDHQVWRQCYADSRCGNPNHRRGQHYGWEHLTEEPQIVQGPQFLGEKAFSQWDDNDPCQTTVTTLVRTEMALHAGGYRWKDDGGRDAQGNRRGEDHDFARRCRKAGARMRHHPEVTWTWHHHASNTSGLPTW